MVLMKFGALSRMTSETVSYLAYPLGRPWSYLVYPLGRSWSYLAYPLGRLWSYHVFFMVFDTNVYLGPSVNSQA